MTNAPIPPERIAAKLAAIRNLESPTIAEEMERTPRLVELLWAVQWWSMQPGGLAKFAAHLVNDFPEHFGTKTLIKLRGQKLSYQDKRTIFDELPASIAFAICPAVAKSPLAWHFDAQVAMGIPEDNLLSEIETERELQIALKEWDSDRFCEACEALALKQLPAYLHNVCVDLDTNFSDLDTNLSRLECCPDVPGLLFAAIDAHAKRRLEKIAQTAVTEKVFDALDYASSERCMVRIEGDSRFGKTESVKAWCESRPGRARLVSVPSSNGLYDLISNVADALGIEHGYKTSKPQTKLKVEFVLRQSGMFLVLDEGTYLLPQAYGRSTAPARLNWVRSEIVDRGLPMALVVTPQSFYADLRKFLGKTGYVMEQFLGRTLMTVKLPNDLDKEDLMSVARIHFPQMGENHLGFIAAQALLTENYLQAIEAIAKRARYLAGRSGRKIALKDIDQAVAEVVNSTAPRQPKRVEAEPIEAEQPVSRPVKSALSARSRSNFDSCSLRGAGSEVESPELISADP
jgi:hypothetical protein